MSAALQRLEALRAGGANRFDPVAFHFLETLAGRLQTAAGAMAKPLEQKLAQALAAYESRLEPARKSAKKALVQGAKRFPDAAENLTQLFDQGDYPGLRQRIEQLGRAAPSPLAELLAHLAAAAPLAGAADSSNSTDASSSPASRPAPEELKAVRYFRESWSRLSTEQVVAQSLASAPENAGPLNSHMLVLKAIELMRDTAPAYLSHFITYADTLLWLEQTVAAMPTKKPAPAPEGDKKRKPRAKR